MTFLHELFSNRILISAFAAWAVTQLAKTVIDAILNKGIDWERLIGDGGMPSCHSATVCALATAVALQEGVSTPIFAVSAVFAVVVMHDALGVRRESGRHAKALNDLLEILMGAAAPEEKLKEMLGHTPLQVFIGGAMGICIAFLLRK